MSELMKLCASEQRQPERSSEQTESQDDIINAMINNLIDDGD